MIRIPPPWREDAGGAETVEAAGETLRQVVSALARAHPDLAARMVDGDRLASGLAVAIDGTVATGGLFTPVGPESEIDFLPAVAGG